MIDDVTDTQQDLHPTINHQAGIYTPGELVTERREGEAGLSNKSISEHYSILLQNVAFICTIC